MTPARLVGTTCGRAGTGDVVDASVVVGAVARRDGVVTSDPRDIRQLASALGVRLQLFEV
jgi:hypothetical protein